MREIFDYNSTITGQPKLLLTAVVSANIDQIEQSYDSEALAK